jgi:hypothetical protein
MRYLFDDPVRFSRGLMALDYSTVLLNYSGADRWPGKIDPNKTGPGFGWGSHLEVFQTVKLQRSIIERLWAVKQVSQRVKCALLTLSITPAGDYSFERVEFLVNLVFQSCT